MLKKVLVWGGIAFIMFFVAFRPSAAGSVARQLGNTFVDIMQGVGDFFAGIIG